MGATGAGDRGGAVALGAESRDGTETWLAGFVGRTAGGNGIAGAGCAAIAVGEGGTASGRGDWRGAVGEGAANEGGD
jgi:hypothetical protein